MDLCTVVLRGANGAALKAVPTTVYLADGTTLAPAIFAADGSTLTNPFNSSDNGQAQFGALGGKYVVSYATAFGTLTLNVQLESDFGSVVTNVRNVTDAATIDSVAGFSDHTFSMDASGGEIDQTLPSLATVQDGRELVFSKDDATGNLIVITPNGTDDLNNGNPNVTLADQGASVRFKANKVKGFWMVMGG